MFKAEPTITPTAILKSTLKITVTAKINIERLLRKAFLISPHSTLCQPPTINTTAVAATGILISPPVGIRIKARSPATVIPSKIPQRCNETLPVKIPPNLAQRTIALVSNKLSCISLVSLFPVIHITKDMAMVQIIITNIVLKDESPFVEKVQLRENACFSISSMGEIFPGGISAKFKI